MALQIWKAYMQHVPTFGTRGRLMVRLKAVIGCILLLIFYTQHAPWITCYSRCQARKKFTRTSSTWQLSAALKDIIPNRSSVWSFYWSYRHSVLVRRPRQTVARVSMEESVFCWSDCGLTGTVDYRSCPTVLRNCQGISSHWLLGKGRHGNINGQERAWCS